MALIFQRLARNFIKNGYFPTDADTLARIIKSLSFSGSSCRIFDPCCGEGTALAEIKHALSDKDDAVTAFGVEYDEERAWHSKQLLDQAIHGDLRDCWITARQFGLLFLNPPYGDAVADNAQLSAPTKGRLRLEKEFYRRTNGLLQFNGVMVLILPYYVLDKELSTWISRHFHEVSVYKAPEQQFKQCVIFGIKQKVTDTWSTSKAFKNARDHLIAVGNGDVEAVTLPLEGCDHCIFSEDGRYPIPTAEIDGDTRFELIRLDARQLAESLTGDAPGVWPQFETLFNPQRSLELKRPLCDVSNWHLALMLAAGQVSGVVNSPSGRTFVVRGDTYKDKQVTVSEEAGAKGSVIEVRTHTDMFVPAIRGLDMTPGSATLGEVYTIK